MRCTGDIRLEYDFSSGSDMIRQILSQPKVAERMEFELFGRLAVYTWDYIVLFNFYIV